MASPSLHAARISRSPLHIIGIHMIDIDKYLAVTWREAGRVYPNLDCFGTANEIRRDLNLEPWPDFAGVSTIDSEALKFMSSLELCEPREGVGIACYSGSMVIHVAIVVNINGILHAAECRSDSGVLFIPLPRFERRYLKVEYYQ